MKIVFLDQSTFQRPDECLDYSCLQKLGDFISYDSTSDAQLADRVQDAEVVITVGNTLFVEQLKSFSHVKLICKAGSGYDRIDIVAANERGIGVCNLPGYGTYILFWNLLVIRWLMIVTCGNLTVRVIFLLLTELQSCVEKL
jgi:glycerate dehydrogenase